MKSITRNWRVVIGGAAAGSAALIGIAGTKASAEPIPPAPPVPAPVTVTQTVTVAPQANAAAASAAPAATTAVAPAPAATAASAAPVAPATSVAPTPAAPPIFPASTGTIKEFFKEKGVTLEPQKAAGFTALNIVLPVPAGWTLVPDPNVPDAFTVIADRKGGDALYTPNAQLTVYKLVGDFDPREAISHGLVDSQLLPNWQSTNAALDEFGGFPSSQIEGTYRDTDLTLNTNRRHVIAQSGSDRYLVTLSVTTAANQVVAAASATEGITKGFKVSVPGAAPAATVAAAPVNPLSATVPGLPAAAAVPAIPAVPAQVPLTVPGAAAVPTAPAAVAAVPATAALPASAPAVAAPAAVPAAPVAVTPAAPAAVTAPAPAAVTAPAAPVAVQPAQ